MNRGIPSNKTILLAQPKAITRITFSLESNKWECTFENGGYELKFKTRSIQDRQNNGNAFRTKIVIWTGAADFFRCCTLAKDPSMMIKRSLDIISKHRSGSRKPTAALSFFPYSRRTIDSYFSTQTFAFSFLITCILLLQSQIVSQALTLHDVQS